MPFTFSHPAIVLPFGLLSKRWVSLTGLIMGSITPDFEYFIRLRIHSEFSHTIPGLFWFNLPLGIILTFIFHGVVKRSLILNLPRFLRQRFSSFVSFNWSLHFTKCWLTIFISILMGAASHLLWDSFTHDHGYFVIQFDTLKQEVEIFSYNVTILKILQHGSTLIGGLVIIVAILKLEKHTPIKPNVDLRYWIVIVLISSSFLFTRFLFGLDVKLIGNVIVTVISGGLVSLILTPFILRLKK